MILLILVFISIALLLLNSLLDKIRVVRLAAKIPGHNGLPLVGILPEFFGASNEEIFGIIQKYTSWPTDTPLAKLWLGPELIVVVNSPASIQTVFNSSRCLARPNFFDFIDLKKGLLFGTIDIWRSHRSVLDKAFSLTRLKSLLAQFDEKSKRLVEQLSKCTGDVNIYSHVSLCFLDTFLKTTMEYDSDNSSELLRVHDRTVETIADRMSKVWLHSELATTLLKLKYKRKIYVNELLKYVDNIRENMKACCSIMNANGAVESKSDGRERFYEEDYGGGGEDARAWARVVATPIKVLEQAGFNDDEIEEELMTLILAAQDPSSLILSASILMLAMHKDVQRKAYEEVTSLSLDDQNSLSFDAVVKLKYIEMIVKETLRLFPVDHMTVRTTCEEIVLDNFRIPSGAKLVIPAFSVHRNERIWGADSNSFRPERFESFAKIHPYAFIPFTGGSRICLGRKYAMLFMKTCLARLLLNYQLDTKLKFDDIRLKFSVTLKLAQDYVITLERRERS